jgi:hypothetical protein
VVAGELSYDVLVVGAGPDDEETMDKKLEKVTDPVLAAETRQSRIEVCDRLEALDDVTELRRLLEIPTR